MNNFKLYKKHIGIKLAIPIVIVSAVFIALIVALNYYFITSYGENEIEKKIQRSTIEVEQNIERIENKALWLASTLSELHSAKRAYKAYYATGDLQASSMILQEELDDIMKGIERDLGTEARIHYHIPPANSFIRGWTGQRGDDVSAFRNTILEISENHKAITGIEAGRGGFVIRALAPIFGEDKQYYGSVELLFPASEFIHVSKIDETEEFALFMHTDMLEITTAFAEQAKRYNNRDENIFGELIFVEATSENFLKTNMNSEKINRAINGLEVFRSDRYTYAAFPIRAYNGDAQGVGVLQFDKSDLLATERASQTTNIIVGSALILLLILLIIFFNHLIIMRPMKDALLSLEHIKNGKLNRRFSSKRIDEIGQLQNFISEMQTNLHQVVSGIRIASNAVVDSSIQLQKASEDISSGSSQQASSAQQIAASIEQMSANITQNRDNAENTEKNVSESLRKVLSGAQIMKQNIEANNDVIKKIGVVSEIAEKIDLLSINAGIQAAGGSSSGREFSVVANEIRKLADKTAAAADEINKLTEKNIGLSNETEKALSEITPAIQSTGESVKQISSSSREQSHAADQINNSVQEFSDVTQRNALTSDLLLKQADKLSQHAASLQDIVSYFELNSEDEEVLL